MTKDEALKLALEAIKRIDEVAPTAMAKCVIPEIEQALAQPELTLDGLTPIEFALRELYEFQEATGCDSAAEFKAQPEQEPVAYGMWDTQLGRGARMMMVRLDKGQDGCTAPLYTTPPQRKPLSDEEIEDIWADCPIDWDDQINILTFARAIEAAHGIGEKK